jgi:hypothetical protein
MTFTDIARSFARPSRTHILSYLPSWGKVNAKSAAVARSPPLQSWPTKALGRDRAPKKIQRAGVRVWVGIGGELVGARPLGRFGSPMSDPSNPRMGFFPFKDRGFETFIRRDLIVRVRFLASLTFFRLVKTSTAAEK